MQLVNKLLYRSKQRGFLELDLLVGLWAEQHIPQMDSSMLQQFSVVLEQVRQRGDVEDTLDGSACVECELRVCQKTIWQQAAIVQAELSGACMASHQGV
jgi:hypothetical protein